MKTLICAATQGELDTYGSAGEGERLLLTGVGIPCALATVLQEVTRERPVRVLNLGIAGAYPGSGLEIGDIVVGDSEVYGDVGFELPEPPGFRAVTDSDFGDFYREPFALTPWLGWGGAVGRGCTVNACAGTDATGQLRRSLYGAAFETMEGAAVAQVGALLGVPVTEVRAISNFAARRDMRPENIRRALDALADFFRKYRDARTEPGHLALSE